MKLRKTMAAANLHPTAQKKLSLTLRAIKDALKHPELFWHRRFGVMDTNLYPVLKALRASGVQFDYCCDVGSHAGEFALSFALVWPKARLESFEPQPSLVAAHHAKFNRLGHKNYSVHQKIIGAKAIDRNKFYVHSSSCHSSMLKHTFYAEPETTISVSMCPLDAFVYLPGRNLLKIDTEGYENEVLRGAKESLHYFEYVLLEYNIRDYFVGQSTLEEIVCLLKDYDFIGAVHSINDKGLPTAQDLLFKRRNND